jgi:hypothetical protein
MQMEGGLLSRGPLCIKVLSIVCGKEFGTVILRAVFLTSSCNMVVCCHGNLIIL